jgi:hypothetical protein
MSRRLAGLIWFASIVGCLSVADADSAPRRYTLDGTDSFAIAGHSLHSTITYHGDEALSSRAVAGGVRFNVDVTYDEDDGAARGHHRATYALTMAPDGTVSEPVDADPDYLTLLNQPFSVQLDEPTLRDLHALTHAVPFDFPSPMTGAPLHGTLRRLPDVTVGGVNALGIAFTARGPVAGSLPDRPGMALRGTIAMNGTAYYAYHGALLVALEATLAIRGDVASRAGSNAVTITYRRAIRAVPGTGRGR